MLIPIRCFTCNLPLACKYKTYQKYIQEHGGNEKENIISGEPNMELLKNNIYQEAFRRIGIERYCCKRVMVSHIDLIEKT